MNALQACCLGCIKVYTSSESYLEGAERVAGWGFGRAYFAEVTGGGREERVWITEHSKFPRTMYPHVIICIPHKALVPPFCFSHFLEARLLLGLG